MPWTSLRTTALAVVWVFLALGTPASTLNTNSLAATLNRPSVFQSQLSPCPAVCSSNSPQDWTIYTSFDRLSFCDQPILFDLAIHTPVNDTSKTLKFRACTAKDSFEVSNAATAVVANDAVYDHRLIRKTKVTLEYTQQGDASAHATQDVLSAVAKVQTYLGATTDLSKNIMLGYANGSVVGVYAGQALGKATASSVLDQVASHIKATASESILTQLCGGQRDADHTFGVATSAVADLAAVQAALVRWSKGECASGSGITTMLPGVSVWDIPQRHAASNSTNSTSNSTVGHESSDQGLGQRSRSLLGLLSRDTGYCTTKTVHYGDSCTSLAKECGIPLDSFYKYNDKNKCTSLQVDSKVCCNAGSLKPLPYANGTCYTYTVKPDDTCYDIGAPWDLKMADFGPLNDKTTWGWSGCSNMPVGLNICLSSGNPPAPAPLANAMCGPLVPGTEFHDIKDASDLALLNPCPLNSCCNIWGQCGIDPSFCTKSSGPTGNPGTSKPEVYGCISNCGTDITNNDNGPKDGYKRVGYYETFNWGRECLHMRAEWSNTLSYTHMHWAFGSVGDDFSIFINDSYSQWEGFMSLSDVQNIASFGGWGFSTEEATFEVLRSAMTPKNRDLFVSNLVSFVKKTGVDGIDIDWEYPGAPDIPGIPPGLDTDAPNYLATLKAIRKALPDKYSISIAAPASYWYLKAFPISEIAEVVDYIVFMAYDLHGQWDYGNSFSQAGCPTGNCLRSHVNETEVIQSLAMITKAGVKTNKIVVGESSYGRSFHMSNAGCTGQDCFFTGTNGSSDATPGRCTNTSGYISNAEIKEIISHNASSIKTWYDRDTASDYLVYDDVQWVAYMSNKTKEARRAKWKDLNFLGTIDWAVDLQDFNVADTVGPTGDYNESSCVNVFDSMIWGWVNPAIDAPMDCTNLIKPSPLPTTVTLTAYTTITLVSGGSISTTFVSTTFTVSEVSYQPFTIDTTDVASGSVVTYNPVPRVTPSPMGIQVPHGWTVTSAGGQGSSAPTTTQVIGLPPTTTSSTSSASSDGIVVIITWLPTVSYNLPSYVTPKIPAPTVIPDDENGPTPTPVPGKDDCSGDGCTKGTDCEGPNCSRGGDCTGPNCTRGGGCKGPNCVRGGECTGGSCDEGGDCSGDHCEQGGGCSGAKCNKGGGCTGAHCKKGGGCKRTILNDCHSKGGCIGPFCLGIGCIGPWCNDPITINVQPHSPVPTPKPTCLVNCPTLDPCSGGGKSCNEPCNLQKCPAKSMPTAKDCTTLQTANVCTEIISSTAVVTIPTTSFSTTTRTHCHATIDCDAQDRTETTTVTTSEDPGETAAPDGIYDYKDDSTDSKEVFASIGSEYDAWEKTALIAPPTSTSTKPTPTTPKTTTKKPSPTPTADCSFRQVDLYFAFEVYNIDGWASDRGGSLKDQEEGCGALTGWVWSDADSDTPAYAQFNLPLVFKSGCVERAIASAGGPKISCQKGGGGHAGKQLNQLYQPDQLREFDSFYRNKQSEMPPSSDATYVPMDWGTTTATSPTMAL